MLNPGLQLYVNNKWYFDVFTTDADKTEVRVKYYESANLTTPRYKVVKIPTKMFNLKETVGDVTYCQINEYDLKNTIGSLINRLVKEVDYNKIYEDGMGAVVSPGINATPGLSGTPGSGDIGSVMPQGEYGMMIHPKGNAKKRKKLKTKVGKPAIKQPFMILTKENFVEVETDADYKTNLFTFLDYPYDQDMEIKFIKMINKNRSNFLNVSSQRLKLYFKDLYEANKTLIEKSTGDFFQNMVLKLADL